MTDADRLTGAAEDAEDLLSLTDKIPADERHRFEMLRLPESDPDERTQQARNESACFLEYKAAAAELRDAELAMRNAQERYREALTAMNKVVAPMPPPA